MKTKNILMALLMVLMSATTLIAQEEHPQWIKEIIELEGQIDKYRKQKDWTRVSDCMEKLQKIFYAQSVEERKKGSRSEELDYNFYYNFACYSSLAGKTSRALQAFEKFTQHVEAGKVELNLSNINTDTDLDRIRKNKRFISCMERITPFGDYLAKLKNASSYQNAAEMESTRFRYMEPNDSNLVFLRQYYNLDSIAGSGDEISKIKNLLHWVHEVVPHDGSSYNPTEKNTHAMIQLCQKENRGVNCRMMAQMLAEVYLSMGFKARFVTCLPREYVSDCHVITTVYSCTLDKWVWVDPTFDAFVMDENGTMLSISEVRSRLREDKELYLNDYANWNHKSKQTKEHYLDYYMAKNLYYLSCPEISRYNAETWEEGRTYKYHVLMPYQELDKEAKAVGNDIRTADEEWFWQSPYEKL